MLAKRRTNLKRLVEFSVFDTQLDLTSITGVRRLRHGVLGGYVRINDMLRLNVTPCDAASEVIYHSSTRSLNSEQLVHLRATVKSLV